MAAMTDRKSYIYAITDEQDNVRYVGKAANVKSRMTVHKNHKTPVSKWMNENPHKVMVLEECSDKDALRKEHGWIWKMRDEGCDLFNVHPARRQITKDPVPSEMCKKMMAEIESAVVRAHKARITESELCELAGVAYPRYWRAKNGRVGVNPQVKVIRLLEAALDKVEGK